MRIQTEYLSFKTRWMISSSYDFQAHQQCSQRRCHFSQTVLQWFEVLPSWSLALPGAPRFVVGAPRHVICAPRLLVSAPRLVAGAPRCSQVHPKFSPALRGVLKLITITPIVLLYKSSDIPVTPKAGWNALLGSDTVPKSTHLSLHSTSSLTLLESSSD